MELKFAHQWHKNLKVLSTYKKRTGYLNLKEGPVANHRDAIKFKANKIEEEDVKIYFTKDEIEREHKDWMKNHFNPHKL